MYRRWQLMLYLVLYSVVCSTPMDRLPTASAGQTSSDGVVPGWPPATDESLAAAMAGAKADPTSAGAHARLGNALFSRGDIASALLSFNTALKLNPHNSEAKTGKGAILSRKGELASAEKLLREALPQSPEPVRIHYELGLIYQKSGKLNQAVVEFKEGISKFQQGKR